MKDYGPEIIEKWQRRALEAEARIRELEAERDRARDFAIGCISGDVCSWHDEDGDYGDGSARAYH